MPTPNSAGGQAPSWTYLLDGMAQSLAQTLAAVPETPATEVSRPPAASSGTPPGEQALAQAGRRLEQLEGCVRRAEAMAAELDARCAAGLDLAGRLLEQVSAVRQKLARRAGRAV